MGSPSIWMSTVGGSRSVLCTVQWETTACNGLTIPVGKPAGTITRRWIEATEPAVGLPCGTRHGRQGLRGSGRDARGIAPAL
jgi:hypothetical protein